MKTAKPPRIAFLIDPASLLGHGLLTGISNYVHTHGPCFMFYERNIEGEFSARDYRRGLKRLEAWKPDVIVTREMLAIRAMRRLGCPLFVAPHGSRRVEGAVNLISDDSAIGIDAAKHLFEQGYRRLACCGWGDAAWSHARADAFEAAALNLGATVESRMDPESGATTIREDLIPRLETWLKQLKRNDEPVGIFSTVDQRGRDILDICHALGLRVPEQVGVLGVDNHELICELCFPPLSSIARDMESVGKEAAQLIVSLARGRMRDAHDLTVRPLRIVSRGSTEFGAVTEPRVKAALNHIKLYIRQPLSAAIVAEEVGVTPRMLHNLFRDELKTTPAKTIRYLKSEEVIRMLHETTWPASRIATAVGFSSPAHLARFLKQQTGRTPSEFRNRPRKNLPPATQIS